MITTIVQFALPSPISLEEAARRFQSSAPNYKNLPGLIRKYYLRSEDGRRTAGVYLGVAAGGGGPLYRRMARAGAAALRQRAGDRRGSTRRSSSTTAPAKSPRRHSRRPAVSEACQAASTFLIGVGGAAWRTEVRISSAPQFRQA